MATETPAPSRYTRTNPFPAKLVVNRSLCSEGSEKDTRHFEIDLKGWGLNYQVGDSMMLPYARYVEKLKSDKRYERDVN